MKEQKVIIDRIDELRIETKKLEAIYQQKLNDLEELKKSVLQKAFNGELKNIKSGSDMNESETRAELIDPKAKGLWLGRCRRFKNPS